VHAESEILANSGGSLCAGSARTSQGGGIKQPEYADLGDLSDVPQHRLQEVVSLLRSFPSPEDDPGAATELRNWLDCLARLSGFSRELTVQLCHTIAQCLEAPRGPDRGLGATRENLQQGFVRMGGVRNLINTLLLRLDDPLVVAAAARVLAAAVQDSPLAAEALRADGDGNVRLLLRAIERHGSNSAVVEHGCVLMAHLCAPTPRGGTEVAPVRSRAHRHSQKLLAGEGAMDLVVGFLGQSVLDVKVKASRAEELHAKALGSDDVIAAPQKKSGQAQSVVSDSVMRTKASIELRQAWVKLSTLEATAARIQEAALQALLLLSYGNKEMIQMLAGALWCWASAREKKPLASAAANGARSVKPKKGKGKGRESKKKGKGPEQPPSDGLPQGEARCSLDTLAGFEKANGLLVMVLRGRAARDRPPLAARACRLLSLLAEYRLDVLRQIESRRSVELAEQMVSLHCDLPPNDRKPRAPFAPLEDVVQSLTELLRLHSEDAPLLATAVTTIAHFRAVALLSTPAGVALGSDALKSEWQDLLAKAELQDELRTAERVMLKAVELTDTGVHRMGQVGACPDQLTGADVWLTPRMRGACADAARHAGQLAGDILASRWHRGNPDRLERMANAGPVGQAAGQARHGKRSASRGGRTLGISMSEASPSSPSEDSQNSDLTFNRNGLTSTRNGQDMHKHRCSTVVPRLLAATLQKLAEEGPMADPKPMKNSTGMDSVSRSPRSDASATDSKSQELRSAAKPGELLQAPAYTRALGYGVHDDHDFDLVWRKPLTGALATSLSMPVVGRGGEPLPMAEAEALGDVLAGLDISLVESKPGLLKARCVIPSVDRLHQNVTDLRLKQITQSGQAAKELTPALTKAMRKNGCLLPTYGLNFVIKKGRRAPACSHSSPSLAAVSSSTSPH